ncbi:endolytic transglycosylase MltG [Campylobacter lanienae]|uniref:endolytic transglycosylase MltG n=1 Tax=Campylobacter lanienae TaxID=75658 RepID=UPI003AFB4B8D
MLIPIFNHIKRARKMAINSVKNITKKRFLNIIFEIVFIIFLTIFASLSQTMTTSKVVYLPQGSVGEIISYLAKLNFKVDGFDKYILLLMGYPQSGWIDIGTTTLSKFDFLYKLTTAKAAMRDITLIPGETTAYFFYDIAKKFGLDYNELMRNYLANSPIKEGFLVPETYKIPVGISEAHLVYYLINVSKKQHESLSQKIFGQWDERRWYEFIIVASVIQKEAANTSEMPIVSSVIYNRLKIGMKLQMDGTLNYDLYSHEKITPQRIAKDNTRYNTYKYAGLPPNAVCNVSFDAIKAAIFPKKTNYLYFVRDKSTGAHIFSSTYEAHIKAIDRSNKAK